MVWLPADRIVLQGDLFYYEEGGPFPPAGRYTMNHFFASWLVAHQLAPKAIYGVHASGAAGARRLRDPPSDEWACYTALRRPLLAAGEAGPSGRKTEKAVPLLPGAVQLLIRIVP